MNDNLKLIALIITIVGLLVLTSKKASKNVWVRRLMGLATIAFYAAVAVFFYIILTAKVR